MKTVLITGAAGALGSEVLKRFAAEGRFQIIAVDRQIPSGAKPANVEWKSFDLSNISEVRDHLATAPVDILVHCAGGFRWSHLDQISDEDLNFLLSANLLSSIHLARVVLPGMKARGFGRILFVGAKATLSPGAGMGAYAASKSAINMLVPSLAEETKNFNITVNAVLPSILDTPANRKDMPNADFSSWVAPKDLAEILFSLTEPQSAVIHGALIPVAGRV